MSDERITLHLVSDSTGETVRAAVEAAASQFTTAGFEFLLHNFVRGSDGLKEVFLEVGSRGGQIFFTIADSALRAALIAQAASVGIPAVDVLAPIMEALEDRAGRGPLGRPGQQHRVDGEYLRRIGALEFALACDDGSGAERLSEADVVLIGASRTSKTPTCVYLANQGVMAANVPLMAGDTLPDPVLQAKNQGVPVVALIASPQRLSQVRRQRLVAMEAEDHGGYAELDRIREEVTGLRLVCERHGIPVIDVTRRSIEETAASVRAHIRQSAEQA